MLLTKMACRVVKGDVVNIFSKNYTVAWNKVDNDLYETPVRILLLHNQNGEKIILTIDGEMEIPIFRENLEE